MNCRMTFGKMSTIRFSDAVTHGMKALLRCLVVLVPMSLIVPCAEAQDSGREERKGLAQAEKWAADKDPDQRLIEGEFRTPPVGLLNKLLLDEDPNVSTWALSALKSIAERGQFSIEQA